MRRAISLIAGLLTGVVVGTAIALLFAPASGENLRLQIRKYVGNMQQEINLAASSKRAEMEKQLETLRVPRHGDE